MLNSFYGFISFSFLFLFYFISFYVLLGKSGDIQLFNYSIGYSVRYSMPKLSLSGQLPVVIFSCSILLLTFCDLQWKCVTRFTLTRQSSPELPNLCKVKILLHVFYDRYLPQKNSGFRFMSLDFVLVSFFKLEKFVCFCCCLF